MHKENNSQDEMKKALVACLLDVINKIDEHVETNGHNKDGYTVSFADTIIDKKNYVMSLCITPIEDWVWFKQEMGEVITNKKPQSNLTKLN